MKRQIPALPFLPAEAHVVKRERRGNLEKITYLHQGRQYQEERLHMVSKHVTESGQQKARKLQQELSAFHLDEERAFQLQLILDRCPWDRLPETFRQKLFVRNDLAWELKSQIAACLGTKEPAVIEQVLKVDLGKTYPPMTDYRVKERREDEGKP